MLPVPVGERHGLGLTISLCVRWLLEGGGREREEKEEEPCRAPPSKEAIIAWME